MSSDRPDRTTARRFAPWFVAVVVFLVVYNCFDWAIGEAFPADSTDPPGGRSGMTLYVDDLTGCHYLAPLLGGLTPRLDAEGHHVCTGQEVAP